MNNRTQRQLRFVAQYGPWAIVTGSSSGIGREIAFRLAEAGMNLVLASRSTTTMEEIARELANKCNIQTHVVPADLTIDAGIAAIIEATANLDIGLLVASAGFGTSGEFLDSDLPAELDMLAVNCRALTALSWHFGRRLRQRGRGGMILMSSIVGFQGMPNAAHYAATKAYVQTLAEALYVELRRSGVDVLAAAPGPVASRFADRAGMKMGKALTPQRVAQPILDALGKHSTVIPGFFSKLLKYSLTGLPRWAKVRIMGKVMAGMTKHRRPNDTAQSSTSGIAL